MDELSVVDSRSAVIRTEPAAAALVLMTCYPFDALMAGGPLRYVVTAHASANKVSPPAHGRDIRLSGSTNLEGDETLP